MASPLCIFYVTLFIDLPKKLQVTQKYGLFKWFIDIYKGAPYSYKLVGNFFITNQSNLNPKMFEVISKDFRCDSAELPSSRNVIAVTLK